MYRPVFTALLLAVSAACAGAQPVSASAADLDAAAQLFHSGDSRAALSTLHTLAAQNHAPALYQLGLMSYYGEYLPQDFNQAQQRFEQAAQQNLFEAELMLGMMYYKGDLADTAEHSQARRWLERAYAHAAELQKPLAGKWLHRLNAAEDLEDKAVAQAWINKLTAVYLKNTPNHSAY